MANTIFVPGRLCLFGEHSDWAGKYRTMNADVVPGAALVTGIEQGIEAEIEKSSLFEMRCTAPEIPNWQDFSCRMDFQELKDVARSNSFFSYCAGVASYMLEWYKVGGVRITITKMDMPMKSGLSSSAAICVLVCRAFNQLYRLRLNTLGEMNIAYWGELRTSSRCGRLDQACAFGVHPVKMVFDGEDVDVENFNIKETLYWVFSNLDGEKDTIKILRDLNRAYPFAETDKEKNEHRALGAFNQDIINRAIEAMRVGDAPALGCLMVEAQEIFDKYVAPMCPEELTAPKLHALLDDPRAKELSWGGKGVGSQGDGSIQFLAKDKDCQTKLVDYLRSKGLQAYPLTIEPKHTIRKAIVPVAGFGTRLYPATRNMKKDFFPIIDKDGLVKPVILIILEELVASGIDEICLVLGGKEERELYRNYFDTPLAEEHRKKLKPEMQAYEDHILEIGKRLHYVYQTEKRGFGHAVSLCSNFAAGEPVLLCLGDTLYKSNTNKPCALQFVEAFDKYGKPMVSIHDTPLEKVSYYGIISGEWVNKRQTVLEMTNITEKPTASYAEEHLGVPDGRGGKRYFSVFGQYILTHEVFEQLDANVAAMEGDTTHEVELTTALEQVRDRIGMMGVCLDGEMFDMGNPRELKNTYTNYNNL